MIISNKKEETISLEEFKQFMLSDKQTKEDYEMFQIKQDIIKLFLNYRKEYDLPQKALADILETSQQAVSRLEKNSINYSIEFIAKALRKMGYRLKLEKLENKK